MSRRLHAAVDRWLGAEGAAAGAADAALRRVFRALPQPPLPAGFVERVMLGAGLAVARPAAAPLVWRLLAGGALALAAGAAAAAPRLAAAALGWVSPGGVIRFAAGAVVESGQRFAEGLAVWRTLRLVGETFAEVLSGPPFLAALLAATLLSAGGLRILHGLLAPDRSPENARA